MSLKDVTKVYFPTSAGLAVNVHISPLMQSRNLLAARRLEKLAGHADVEPRPMNQHIVQRSHLASQLRDLLAVLLLVIGLSLQRVMVLPLGRRAPLLALAHRMSLALCRGAFTHESISFDLELMHERISFDHEISDQP